MTRDELRRLVRSRRERAITFLQEAIRIPSITKHERAMGDSRFVISANERVELEAYVTAIEAFVLTFERIQGVAR